MANSINNIAQVGTVIAKLAAGMLADKLQFVKTIDKEPSSSFDQVNGYNVGQTITINKPARFVPTQSADITSSIQDVYEEKTTLTLNLREVVGINLTSLEIQNELRLKDWTKRILDPAVSSIAQAVEANFLATAANAVYNSLGTPGSTIYDTDLALSAREKLKKNLVPANDQLSFLCESSAMRSAVNARKGLFQQSEKIGEQYEDGMMGRSDGFKWYENNLLPVHTSGSATGAITVTATPTDGAATINLTGTGSQTLLVGDVFTVAGTYAVHPITKVAYNYLQQFVVTANNTASGGAFTGVQISPAMYDGSYSEPGLQNISLLPQTGATVTLVATAASTAYQQNLAYHKSAFRFASVPLMKPDGTHMCAQETVDDITLRVWMDSIVLTDKMVMRIDFLGGFSAVRPEWAARIWS